MMKANERLLSAIGQVSDEYIAQAAPGMVLKTDEKAVHEPKKRRATLLRRGFAAAAVAACFVLMAVAGLPLYQNQTVTLENEEAIVFGKVGSFLTSDQLLENIDVRELTAEELRELFPGWNLTSADGAIGYFDADSQTSVGVEVRIEDVKILLSADERIKPDTLLDGGKMKESTVKGVLVNAGYTNANHSGEKIVIYFAEFTVGRIGCRLEAAGTKAECEAVREKLAGAVLRMIQNGEPDLGGIRE